MCARSMQVYKREPGPPFAGTYRARWQLWVGRGGYLRAIPRRPEAGRQLLHRNRLRLLPRTSRQCRNTCLRTDKRCMWIYVH